MRISKLYLIRGAALLPFAALLGCGDNLNISFPRPSEPLEETLFDLVAGPIDRPSGLNVVSGRGSGSPRAVRVDESSEWDVAFAIMGGEPVWLPQGFFEAFEPSSGIVRLEGVFDQIQDAPSNRELYETEDPVPLVEGATYAIRSRNDPALSLPCRIFAKLEVISIEGDPTRARIRILWNPNCDRRRVTPGDPS